MRSNRYSKQKTYNLSIEAIAALECLTERICEETSIKFTMSKVLELCVFFSEHEPIERLIRKK